jgi:hypothetical protein
LVWDAAGGGAPAHDGDGLPAVHVLHGDRPGDDPKCPQGAVRVRGGGRGRVRGPHAGARGVRAFLRAAGRLHTPGAWSDDAGGGRRSAAIPERVAVKVAALEGVQS